MRALGIIVLIALLAGLSVALSACGGQVSSGAGATASPTSAAASPTAEPTPAPTIATAPQGYFPVRTIMVQGTADVLGRDIAYLNVSFNVRGPDMRTALNRAEEVNQAVRRALDEVASGAEVHDENISSYPPSYGYPASAYRTISVEISDSADLANIMGALDERVRGILTTDEYASFNSYFETEKGGFAASEARAKAIAEAKAAAEEIAQLNGLTLGEILSVVEGSDVQLSLSAPAYGPAPAGAGAAAAGGGSSSGYPFGATEPVITVTVTFALK